MFEYRELSLHNLRDVCGEQNILNSLRSLLQSSIVINFRQGEVLSIAVLEVLKLVTHKYLLHKYPICSILQTHGCRNCARSSPTHEN